MSNMTTPPDDKQNTNALNATDANSGAQQKNAASDAAFQSQPISTSSLVTEQSMAQANDVVNVSHDQLSPVSASPRQDTQVVESMSQPAASTMAQKNCQNCGFQLDGPFCGKCGQPERTTIKFVGSVIMHFLDDIFGYDSRAGRTILPLIFRPGFLTCEYFKGRRVHYVPPLRLYFFVSIIFFLMLELFTDDSVKELQQIQQTTGQEAIAKISDEIDKLEQQMAMADEQPSHFDKRHLENLREQKSQAVKNINEQISKLQLSIDERNPDKLPIEQLEQSDQIAIRAIEHTIVGLQMNLDEHPNYPGVKDIQDKIATFDRVYALSQGNMSEKDQQQRDVLEAQLVELMTEDMEQAKAKQGENKSKSVTKHFKPEFSWLAPEQNKKLQEFMADMEHKAKVAFEQDAAPLVNQVLGVLPQMMFFLLPIFALILKIFYLFSKRFYMEHLTVALHSHAFIFVVLMILAIVSSSYQYLPVEKQTASQIAELVVLALVFWMPIYLFLMQKRVYRQGIFMTMFKYFIVGMTYVLLLGVVTLIAFFWGLAHT